MTASSVMSRDALSGIEALRLRDPRLEPVRRAVLDGRRLDEAQALACLETPDVFGLAGLAHAVKRARHGDRVSFVLNRQLNPTNLCVLRCGFCDFAARPGEAHAYELSRDQIVEAVGGEIRELHIVGGLHPRWGLEKALDVVRWVRAARPDVQVKAYTAVEVDWFAHRSRLPLAEVLVALREAGVATLPGGGAEVFSERVRELLFPHKIGAERWLEVHRTAHALGIPSGATLLYGHVETLAERARHLLRLRETQDETGGFRAFIPLAYQAGSRADRSLLPAHTTSALDDLRTIATSRLVLDNFDHVKAYWIMLGLASAVCALQAGASDLDGTVGRERIAHAAGATSPERLTRGFLEDLIREAGAVPVERDALYRPALPAADLASSPATVEARA
jgi:aminodeoxyfutalosine synthase